METHLTRKTVPGSVEPKVDVLQPGESPKLDRDQTCDQTKTGSLLSRNGGGQLGHPLVQVSYHIIP